MVETTTEESGIQTKSVPAVRPNNLLRPSRFKYYIHDGVDACRLQLIGELTQAELPELSGCWSTAQTTLGKRKLILDLHGLRSVDEAGTEWVTSMARHAAEYVPQSVLQNGVLVLAGLNTALLGTRRRPSRFGRLLAILRSSRMPCAESSTQAQ